KAPYYEVDFFCAGGTYPIQGPCTVPASLVFFEKDPAKMPCQCSDNVPCGAGSSFSQRLQCSGGTGATYSVYCAHTGSLKIITVTSPLNSCRWGCDPHAVVPTGAGKEVLPLGVFPGSGPPQVSDGEAENLDAGLAAFCERRFFRWVGRFALAARAK